jgi:surface antigen
MRKFVKTAIVFSAIALAGCSNVNKQDIGTVTGAVAGGLLGSQFGNGAGKLVAVGAGTLAGAFIGGAIGKNMDETDQLKAQQAFERTPTGEASSWHNPDTGKSYTVRPTKTFVHQGRPCREYTMLAEINGKKEKVYGKACRQADGSWKTQR